MHETYTISTAVCLQVTNEVVVRMRIEGYRWGVRKVRSCRHAKCRLGYGAGCVDTVPCAQGRAPTHKVWRARCNSRRATGVAGLGSPLPHLRRDSAHPSFICTGTWLTPATSALGLGSPLPTSAPGLGSPRLHLHWDWNHPAHIAPGLGSPLPHLHRDWACPSHISAPGLGSPQPHSAPGLRSSWSCRRSRWTGS